MHEWRRIPFQTLKGPQGHFQTNQLYVCQVGFIALSESTRAIAPALCHDLYVNRLHRRLPVIDGVAMTQLPRDLPNAHDADDQLRTLRTAQRPGASVIFLGLHVWQMPNEGNQGP